MRALLAIAGSLFLLFPGVEAIQAQGSWVRLVVEPSTESTTRVWADTNSWARSRDGTLSVRLRIVDGRADGGRSLIGSVYYLDVDCTRQLYRLRRTEFVNGERVTGVLPASMESQAWQAPNPGWNEAMNLQAICKARPRFMER